MCLSVVCNAYTIVMGMQPGAPPHCRDSSLPPPLAGDKMPIASATDDRLPEGGCTVRK